MTVRKKADMQGYVFEGISAVYACKDGIESSENSMTVSVEDLLELPVSKDSGFNLTGGTPTVNHFKVHGLNADWVSSFTPGDSEVTLEIPCYDDEVLDLCYGEKGVETTLTLGENSLTGKAHSFDQKAITLGLLVVDEAEKHLLVVKKVKFIASVAFDGSDKPYCITLTGSISGSAESDAVCIFQKKEEESDDDGDNGDE